MAAHVGNTEIIIKQNDFCTRDGNAQEYVLAWQDLAACSTPEAREYINYKLAAELCVLPLSVIKRADGSALLSLLIADDADADIVKSVSFASGLPIEFERCSKSLIQKAVIGAYKSEEKILETDLQSVEAQTKQTRLEEAPINTVLNSPLPKLLSTIIEQALARDASDIHIEPNRQGYQVRYRINGAFLEPEKVLFTQATGQALVRRIKVLCALDISNDRQVQEGGFQFETTGWNIRLRVSILPTIRGEKVALRLLDNRFLDEVLAASSPHALFGYLGFSNSDELCLRHALASRSGAILVCGPTGCGKSTLLYACLTYLARRPSHIVTIEDPVERVIEGVTHIEVGGNSDGEMGSMLRKVLRQDLDVLMVGEMRDSAGASLALTAAATGHLVLSSIHSTDCIQALVRLTQLGIDRKLLASSLKIIVSQRLLAKNCPHCKRKIIPSVELKRLLQLTDRDTLFVAQGCAKCGFQKYKGRIVVYELLRWSEQLIADLTLEVGVEELDSLRIREIAKKHGYRPLALAIRDSLLRGEISPVTALDALGIPAELFGLST